MHNKYFQLMESYEVKLRVYCLANSQPGVNIYCEWVLLAIVTCRTAPKGGVALRENHIINTFMNTTIALVQWSIEGAQIVNIRVGNSLTECLVCS